MKYSDIHILSQCILQSLLIVNQHISFQHSRSIYDSQRIHSVLEESSQQDLWRQWTPLGVGLMGERAGSGGPQLLVHPLPGRKNNGVLLGLIQKKMLGLFFGLVFFFFFSFLFFKYVALCIIHKPEKKCYLKISWVLSSRVDNVPFEQDRVYHGINSVLTSILMSCEQQYRLVLWDTQSWFCSCPSSDLCHVLGIFLPLTLPVLPTYELRSAEQLCDWVP